MKQKGITLIELVISISVVIVLLSIGTVALSGFRKSQSVENEAKRIVFTLKSAQNKAANQECNSRWGVTFDNPGDSDTDYYFIYKVDTTSPSIAGCEDAAGTVFDQTSLKSGIKFTTPAPASSSTVIFSKATGLPDSNQSILIFREDNTREILINTNGRLDYH